MMGSMSRALVWDDGDGASEALAPELGENACFKVVGAYWWFHPSFDSPTLTGDWRGDLTPGKTAAQADFERRLEENNRA